MPDLHSGVIAVVGKPNVGKSTLINALVGQKVAAVSPRPQTTRQRQLGILTTENAQLIFVDTPGIHQPRHKLGQYLNQEAAESLKGIDVVLWLVDAASAPSDDDNRIAALLDELKPASPLILAANKIDLLDKGHRRDNSAAYSGLLHRQHSAILISAKRKEGLPDLINLLSEHCPVRAPEYDAEQVTDAYERQIAADLIREAALFKLRDEVPHAVAVRIDEFKERSNGVAYIAATIFVERESQKAIVIGEGGKMLKEIGTRARREIEAMGDRRVYLELRVKVEKDWRNNEKSLQQFGYGVKR